MPQRNDQQQRYVVGVDLGGTKILAGVFDSQLNCIGRSKMSTKPARGASNVLSRVARCVLDAVDECDLTIDKITAIGVGAPGAVDPASGKVIFAPNLGWRNVLFRKLLEKQLGVPVFAENDANICALGVHTVELKSRPQHMVGIFIGTGIGAGIILNGQLHSGFNRTAGEIGHMVLQTDGPKCACGNRGCFEALAGRTALFRKIQEQVKAGQKTVLTDMLGPELTDMRSGDLRKAVRRGDEFVAQIIDEAARYTGVAVGNVINLLNPEVVVLGGGLIDALEAEMMDVIVKTARQCAMPGTDRGIQIIASNLADDAGIVGGAVLAKQRAA